ncbi:MAG: NADH-quinone oxidoreductase subunit J [Fibrella sp.]|nr:NADH-quinone oxidoreductase subunit J [Armatimonadota bacterium]
MPSMELIQAFLAPQVILFLLFGAGALATALTMLLHPNPVRAALFLVLNLFCVAVLYLLLNAYFLAAVQVVVYAGAIMVLFLFVIMLLNLGTPDRTRDHLRIQQPLAALAGLVLAGAVAIALVRTMPLPVLDESGNPPKLRQPRGPRARAAAVAGLPEPVRPDAITEPGGGGRMTPAANEDAVVMPENAARSAANPNAVPSAEQGTVAGVGKALYDPNLPYLFPFEVTSILLLIATIGSVVLAQRKTPSEKSLDTEELV